VQHSCTEINLWSKSYVKNEGEHFGNEIGMVKTENMIKESVKKIAEFLFKIFQKTKRMITVKEQWIKRYIYYIWSQDINDKTVYF
jgi:RNA binding exosome subunit